MAMKCDRQGDYSTLDFWQSLVSQKQLLILAREQMDTKFSCLRDAFYQHSFFQYYDPIIIIV